MHSTYVALQEAEHCTECARGRLNAKDRKTPNVSGFCNVLTYPCADSRTTAGIFAQFHVSSRSRTSGKSRSVSETLQTPARGVYAPVGHGAGYGENRVQAAEEHAVQQQLAHARRQRQRRQVASQQRQPLPPRPQRSDVLRISLLVRYKAVRPPALIILDLASHQQRQPSQAASRAPISCVLSQTLSYEPYDFQSYSARP